VCVFVDVRLGLGVRVSKHIVSAHIRALVLHVNLILKIKYGVHVRQMRMRKSERKNWRKM